MFDLSGSKVLAAVSSLALSAIFFATAILPATPAATTGMLA